MHAVTSLRWAVCAWLLCVAAGLSGCVTGLDPLSGLEGSLGAPALTGSLTVGVEGTQPVLSGGPMPSVESGGVRDQVPSAESLPLQPEPLLVQAQTDQPAGQAEPASPPVATPPPDQPSAPPAGTEPKGVPPQDENFDPFAKADGSGQVEEYDPWEPFNVAMFQFNRKMDEWLVRPVAKAYDKVVPDGVEQGFSNAFHNIRSVPRILNNLFQGKFKGAGIETSRLLLNSTFGLAGFFDFAKENYDLETPDEDFGQTLGVYGTRPGPYLVVPVLGSFTVRDGAGYIVDLFLDPFNILLFPFIVDKNLPQVVTNEDTITLAQIGIRAGYIVNERALNIDTTFEGVEESVVDLYGAVRNAYLQRRAKMIRE